MKRILFEKIEQNSLKGKTVFLDIDGTIVPEKEVIIPDLIKNKIKSLSDDAKVYLCSNGSQDRSREMALQLGVSFISAEYKKPNPLILNEVTDFISSGSVVVGDKVVTDGFLACLIGADFVLVHPLHFKKISLKFKIIYFLDNVVSVFFPLIRQILPMFYLLRPKHWIKNILVFAPLFFVGLPINEFMVREATLSFLGFCFISSLVYVINDYHDQDLDRQHSHKRFRPLALGLLSSAEILFLIIFLVSLISFIIFKQMAIAPFLFIYLLINILYTHYLKNIAIVDITIVSLLYVLRVIAGGAVAKIFVSPWIVLCVFFGALFLVSGKRRAENFQSTKRSVLSFYTPETSNSIVLASAILAVSAYGLYGILGTPSDHYVYTIPLVFIAIFRIWGLMIKDPNGAEFPESFIFKDLVALGAIVSWILLSFMLIYY